MSGALHRGYFVEGVGGSQFFITDAVEVLRDVHRRTIDNRFPTYTVCTADLAWPYGTVLAWRDMPGAPALSFLKRLRRKSSCYVTVEAGTAWLYLDISSGWVTSLYDESLNPLNLGEAEVQAKTSRALEALLDWITGRIAKPLAIREADARLEYLLMERGFLPTPKGWMAGSSLKRERIDQQL